MKNKTLVFILVVFLPQCLFSQTINDKFEVNVGAGIFFDIVKLKILAPYDKDAGTVYPDLTGKVSERATRKVYTGTSFWGGVTYKLNEKYALTANYYHVYIDKVYNDPLALWWNINEKHRYFRSQAGIKRTFASTTKTELNVGLGIVYQRERYERARYEPVLINGEYYGIATEADKLGGEEGGFDLDIVYRYKITEAANIGLKFNTYYLYQIGIDGVTLSPVISIRF